MNYAMIKYHCASDNLLKIHRNFSLNFNIIYREYEEDKHI